MARQPLTASAERGRRPLLGAVAAVLLLASCASTADEGPSTPTTTAPCVRASSEESTPTAAEGAPERFIIAPDDYHVPYAGTAQDGRKFFLSQELFADDAYVGLFLWHPDGTSDQVCVDAVARPDGLPPGQAAPAGADDLVQARLDELGDYVLEDIDVEPFIASVDGVYFGWRVGQHDDGEYFINIEPGNFIAYYEPWDGLEYDT